MKGKNTKRPPIAGRVRLMFKMLAAVVAVVWLFSQCVANSQIKARKIQKMWPNSPCVIVWNSACEHHSSRR